MFCCIMIDCFDNLWWFFKFLEFWLTKVKWSVKKLFVFNRFIALTEELLLKKSKAESLEHITVSEWSNVSNCGIAYWGKFSLWIYFISFVFQVLNLHGNGLSRLQHVACMTSLKKLTVSFNELTRLDEISHMVRSHDRSCPIGIGNLVHVMKALWYWKTSRETKAILFYYFFWKDFPWIPGRQFQ